LPLRTYDAGGLKNYYVPKEVEARQLLPKGENIGWPKTAKEAEARAEKLIGRKLKVVAGLQNGVGDQAPVEQLKAIPFCAPPAAPRP